MFHLRLTRSVYLLPRAIRSRRPYYWASLVPAHTPMLQRTEKHTFASSPNKDHIETDQSTKTHKVLQISVNTNSTLTNSVQSNSSNSKSNLEAEHIENPTKIILTEESATQTQILPKTFLETLKYYLTGYSSLSKFKLSALVLSTTMVGYAMAPGSFVLSSFLIASFGTGATICAANSINQIIEVNNDSLMNRTKKRWLPTKRITVTHAKCFAGVCAVSGVGSLLFLNPLTAGLAFFNLGLYTAVYTPMKQKNPANTWIGAVVGAIPPMIGWAAATGGAEMGSWIIGALLAFWQMPHFMALSYSLKDDYHRGGFKMLINTHPEKVPGVILRYSIALLPIGFLSYYAGMTSGWFALDYIIPSGYLTYLAIKFSRNPDKQIARQIFKFSLLFLPVAMMLMIFHKIYQPLPQLTQTSESASPK